MTSHTNCRRFACAICVQARKAPISKADKAFGMLVALVAIIGWAFTLYEAYTRDVHLGWGVPEWSLISLLTLVVLALPLVIKKA